MLSLSAHLIPVDKIISPSHYNNSLNSNPNSNSGIRVNLFDVKNEDQISDVLNDADGVMVETIAVDCCRLVESHFESIWNKVSRGLVQKLFLRCCDLSISGVKVLANELEKSECNLIELDLRWNELGDECPQILGQCLSSNKSIEKLYLARNNITVNGTRHLIQALINNSKLELLDLEDNKINNCELFADLIKKNRTLRTIQLNRNPMKGINFERSLCMISEALLRNFSLIKITLPHVTNDDKSLNYYIGIIDQQLNRNTLISVRTKLKHTAKDSENSGQFESDIQSIQTLLKNASINLHSQFSQLQNQRQKEIMDLQQKSSHDHQNFEKSEILDENSKLNTELNNTYLTIHDLQKSSNISSSEIGSLMAVIKEIEYDNQNIKTNIETLEIDKKKSSLTHDLLLQSVQQKPTESDLIRSHRSQMDELNKTMTRFLKDKGSLEKSITQRKYENTILERILENTIQIREHLSKFPAPPSSNPELQTSTTSTSPVSPENPERKATTVSPFPVSPENPEPQAATTASVFPVSPEKPVAQAATKANENREKAGKGAILWNFQLSEKQHNECVICQEKEKVMAFIPCGHKCVCEKCGEANISCPICRKKPTEKLRIYQ